MSEPKSESSLMETARRARAAAEATGKLKRHYLLAGERGCVSARGNAIW